MVLNSGPAAKAMGLNENPAIVAAGFESTDAVQEGTEDANWGAHARDIARVVVIANDECQMVERLRCDGFLRLETS